jgi:hypothetical protein
VAQQPPPRASDAERETVADRLRRAAADGRLTAEELDERLEAAYGARTRPELEQLTLDLPAEGGEPPAVTPKREPAPARRRRWIVNVLGGGDQRGRWYPGRDLRVLSVLGGGDVDLTEAVLEGDVLDVTLIDILGGSDVIVPEGVRVEVDGFVLLGGGDVDLHGPEPGPDAPVVRVHRYGALGGGDVRSRRPGEGRRSRPWGLHRPPRPPRLP